MPGARLAFEIADVVCPDIAIHRDVRPIMLTGGRQYGLSTSTVAERDGSSLTVLPLIRNSLMSLMVGTRSRAWTWVAAPGMLATLRRTRVYFLPPLMTTSVGSAGRGGDFGSSSGGSQ